jgi:prefoldin subunit 5|tara:strand:- start:141 stop:368 length:228 start_codon:yes stop_codon:yes gene_type:complete
MLNENTINERIAILDADISKVTKDIQALEQKKTESTNLLNALMGAKQQCELFLKEFNDVGLSGQGRTSKKKTSTR